MFNGPLFSAEEALARANEVANRIDITEFEQAIYNAVESGETFAKVTTKLGGLQLDKVLGLLKEKGYSVFPNGTNSYLVKWSKTVPKQTTEQTKEDQLTTLTIGMIADEPTDPDLSDPYDSELGDDSDDFEDEDDDDQDWDDDY